MRRPSQLVPNLCWISAHIVLYDCLVSIIPWHPIQSPWRDLTIICWWKIFFGLFLWKSFVLLTWNSSHSCTKSMERFDNYLLMKDLLWFVLLKIICVIDLKLLTQLYKVHGEIWQLSVDERSSLVCSFGNHLCYWLGTPHTVVQRTVKTCLSMLIMSFFIPKWANFYRSILVFYETVQNLNVRMKKYSWLNVLAKPGIDGQVRVVQLVQTDKVWPSSVWGLYTCRAVNTISGCLPSRSTITLWHNNDAILHHNESVLCDPAK